ncbi:HAD family hydrolase [Nesterenkonia flava]|uniref:HAD family hydrolase n=1 Tax=Nesterenkonia flava TaxID=469799 RepID=A0ABU1FX46_9MICC|nr:HAD family hydrolase [Nesterenkonia flava]MDR5712907.1 HAD family hydrolase [Nesterenkonia flava]
MHWDIEAILFDIDGTLVDSTPAVTRNWQTWAARHGLDAQEVLRVCHGRRSRDTVADFLPADQIEEATRELLELELSDIQGVTSLPGVPQLLASLPTGRWAAVTSGAEEVMRRRMEVAQLPLPEVMIAAGDVERGKPDPQGYQMAAAALDCDPRRCLVVEDAPAGVQAGLAAGATVLGVGTSHPLHELRDASVVVEDLTGALVEAGSGTLRFILA